MEKLGINTVKANFSVCSSVEERLPRRPSGCVWTVPCETTDAKSSSVPFLNRP